LLIILLGMLRFSVIFTEIVVLWLINCWKPCKICSMRIVICVDGPLVNWCYNVVTDAVLNRTDIIYLYYDDKTCLG